MSMSASSSPHTSTTSLSNSASTSPTASQHAELDHDSGIQEGAAAASGLRLRLSAPNFNSDDDATSVLSPPETPDAISRAPSLLPLSQAADDDAAANNVANDKSKSKGKSDKAKTKTKTKESKKRLKSPLLDALKLPPLSEISIPRPVQIKCVYHFLPSTGSTQERVFGRAESSATIGPFARSVYRGRSVTGAVRTAADGQAQRPNEMECGSLHAFSGLRFGEDPDHPFDANKARVGSSS